MLAAVLLALALVFAWRSFYRMRIESAELVEDQVVALNTEASGARIAAQG